MDITTLADIICFVGYGLNNLGMWIIGKKNVVGLYLYSIAAVIFFIVGAMVNLKSTMFWSFVGLIISIRNIKKWRKDNERSRV